MIWRDRPVDGRSRPVVDVEGEEAASVRYSPSAPPVRAVDDRERVQDVIDVVAMAAVHPEWMPWWMPWDRW